ncbi:MAG TPA: hypothetical protein VK809_03995 [Bacteroidia bacterium]|nr:hypothetical protein [Bacteroidia bacterium]
MKIKVTFLLLFFFGIAYGQDYNSKQLLGMMQSFVYVVQTGDKPFDDSLVAAVKKYWKICPIKVLPAGDEMAAMKVKGNYFIASSYSDATTIGFGSPMQSSKPKMGIDVFCGDPHLQGRENYYDYRIEACKYPFANNYWFFNLPYVIKTLNEQINIIVKNQLRVMSRDHTGKLYQLFCTNPPAIKDKILLIPDRFSKTAYSEKNLKNYPYKYQYASEKEIIDMVNANPEKYCFVSDEDDIEIVIYDPATKFFLYHSYTTDPDHVIKAKDFDVLMNAINGKQ